MMKYKNIIFDFDGVLVDSNSIRQEGFRLLFNDYPEDEVQELDEYVKSNGGTSRYIKIKYFFEKIRNSIISNDDVKKLANQYSKLVKEKVIKTSAVKGSLEFLSNNYQKYNLAIVSASDQSELIDICHLRKIDYLFKEILGSPTIKEKNISNLLSKQKWYRESSVYVGDTINDLEAAQKNEINFIARDSGLTNWSLYKDLPVIKDLFELPLHLN